MLCNVLRSILCLLSYPLSLVSTSWSYEWNQRNKTTPPMHRQFPSSPLGGSEDSESNGPTSNWFYTLLHSFPDTHQHTSSSRQSCPWLEEIKIQGKKVLLVICTGSLNMCDFHTYLPSFNWEEGHSKPSADEMKWKYYFYAYIIQLHFFHTTHTQATWNLIYILYYKSRNYLLAIKLWITCMTPRNFQSCL